MNIMKQMVDYSFNRNELLVSKLHNPLKIRVHCHTILFTHFM